MVYKSFGLNIYICQGEIFENCRDCGNKGGMRFEHQDCRGMKRKFVRGVLEFKRLNPFYILLRVVVSN